jgi:hypothetical protein
LRRERWKKRASTVGYDLQKMERIVRLVQYLVLVVFTTDRIGNQLIALLWVAVKLKFELEIRLDNSDVCHHDQSTFSKRSSFPTSTSTSDRLPELTVSCLYSFNSLRKWLTPLSTISTKPKVDNKREFAHSFTAHSPIGPNIIYSLTFNFLPILPGGKDKIAKNLSPQ